MRDGLPADVEMDDATLQRFRARDPAAFQRVYRAYAPQVRRWVARFISSAFEQEEVVQDGWLAIHRMAETYDPAKGPLRPWLRTVVLNRCREVLRAKGSRIQPELDLEDWSERLEAPAPTPEQRSRLTRVKGALTRFAASLASPEADVFHLGLVQGYTHEEVAERTGLSVRQCKYLRQKLLDRAAAEPSLREALEELELGGAR